MWPNPCRASQQILPPGPAVFAFNTFGMPCRMEAEAAIHALRAWVGRHAGSHDSVVVKIDFQNAFKTISREAVLGEAREHFPALARWVTWCYQSPSNLQFGDAILQSSTGVQQGDPLGPLLFSAGVEPLAAGLKQGSVDFSIFYLDDGLLAGSLADVSDALTKLQQAAAALGLAVNLSKSEAIAVGMTLHLQTWQPNSRRRWFKAPMAAATS